MRTPTRRQENTVSEPDSFDLGVDDLADLADRIDLDLERLVDGIDLADPTPGETLSDMKFSATMRDEEGDEVERPSRDMLGQLQRMVERAGMGRGNAEAEHGGSAGMPGLVAREPGQRERDAALARLREQQMADDAWRTRW
jgi:hypothetical protein